MTKRLACDEMMVFRFSRLRTRSRLCDDRDGRFEDDGTTEEKRGERITQRPAASTWGLFTFRFSSKQNVATLTANQH
jgi:hypothetical protein